MSRVIKSGVLSINFNLVSQLKFLQKFIDLEITRTNCPLYASKYVSKTQEKIIKGKGKISSPPILCSFQISWVVII